MRYWNWWSMREDALLIENKAGYSDTVDWIQTFGLLCPWALIILWASCMQLMDQILYILYSSYANGPRMLMMHAIYINYNNVMNEASRKSAKLMSVSIKKITGTAQSNLKKREAYSMRFLPQRHSHRHLQDSQMGKFVEAWHMSKFCTKT